MTPADTLPAAAPETPERLSETERRVIEQMRLQFTGNPSIMVLIYDGKNTAIHGCNERLGFVSG